MKLRGAAQGTASLVAEVIVAALAERIGLPVPARRVITLDASTPSDDRNDELADLLAASAGENLGFAFLPTARPLQPADLGQITRDVAARIRWLDWLVLNPDRSPANPNILVDRGELWLIDHGAALPFQHDWSRVTETAPHRAGFRLPHVLGPAVDLASWDPVLTAQFTHEALRDAVAEVPDSFLLPLLPNGAKAEELRRRRAAYEAYLWKRLQGPRDFDLLA